jgi:hypothetical protein
MRKAGASRLFSCRENDGDYFVVVVDWVVVVAVPVPAGVSTVVDFVVSVVVEAGGVVTMVVVSGAFSFTTVVEVDVPELAGVVETSVLQPARPRASRRARA